MQKIICKKVYDTEKSTLIHKRTYGVFGDADGYEESLYQSADGYYFLYVNGGTESKPLVGIVLPGEFISIEHSSEGYTAGFAATSSDDCIFRTWEERVANDSTVEFWEKMICRTLGAKMSFDHIKSEKTLLKGNAAVKITAKVTTSGGLQSYLAVIAIDDCWGSDKLQIVEFFGPEEAYAKHEKEVLDSLQK